MLRLTRMWINQPSTLQQHHKLHGLNVLAHWNTTEDYISVYFLSGPVTGQEVHRLALSPGWRKEKNDSSRPDVAGDKP